MRNMDKIFIEVKSFNQDLSSWCVETFSSQSDEFPQALALTLEDSSNWGSYANYNFKVSENLSGDYAITGRGRNGKISSIDPNSTINFGDEVHFIIDASGHSFYINTIKGTGTDNQVEGALNYGSANGVIIVQ